MEGNFNKVIACMRELGVSLKAEHFQDRLVLQKTVYLLQKLGVKMNFEYNLYLRGPYSPSLTKSLYANKKEFDKLEPRIPLSAPEKERIQKFRRVIDLLPSELEIVSTYTFLTSESGLDEDDAIRRLKQLKPFYSEAQVAVGISKSKQLFFKPTVADLEAIRRETAAWDALSDEALKKAG